MKKKELKKIIEAQAAKIEVQASEIEDLKSLVLSLTQQVASLQKQIFSSKSEKRKPDSSEEGSGTPPKRKTPAKPQTPRTTNRKPLPETLERVLVEIDVPEEDKICDCCGTLQKPFDYDVSETLEFVPAYFKVIRTKRPKYSCPSCSEGGITQALPLDLPIPKSYTTPSLLASIIISKFEDHLPLYRQNQIFSRYGIDIPRSTMDGWLSYLEPQFQLLWEALKKSITSAIYLQADETRITVLNQIKRDPKKKTNLGHMWGFRTSEGVIFLYNNNRTATIPTQFLEEFHGTIQTDDYAGYNEIVRENDLIHILCWAHARRKFVEALEDDPPYVNEILDCIGKLYGLEKKAREEQFSHLQREEIRKENAPKLMEILKKLLENPVRTLTPKGRLGKAVNYTLKNWEKLQLYIQDGVTEIDNNLMENHNRPIAIGRKNWLFAGNEAGAQRYALFYSLIATCKIHGINTYDYFVDILQRLSNHPHTKVHQLLPANWTPLQ